MDKIRAVIVDDEPLAIKRIRDLLQGIRGFEIIGECKNGMEAIEAVESLAPDLLFLDIQMPEINGFDVLQALEPEHRPFVIFVTAFDQYAIKAFEVHALDYLLKPFDPDQFLEKVKRVREMIMKMGSQKNVDKLVTHVKSSKPFSSRLLVKSAGRITFVSISEIEWIESAGNYLRIHVKGELHLMRETMNSMEKQLDPEQFARIHRTAIVNLDRIKEMRPSMKGEFEVELKTGERLIMSRKYRALLEERIGKRF